MTTTYLIAGTASHVGKSTVAAGLCRLLADRGVDVAPFKAQNMSNNARAVPRAAAVRSREAAGEHGAASTGGLDGATGDGTSGDEPSGDGPCSDGGSEPTGDRASWSSDGASRTSDGAPGTTADGASPARDQDAPRDQTGLADPAFGEVGVSQYVQARAARVGPTTDCNPVLLKPRGDAESQVVIDGRPVAHCSAGEFYEMAWERARTAAEVAYRRLAAEHDVVVAEGAGALAEPNLVERDLANVETARFADARIVLVADTERGGAFASVVGTVELLPEDLRERLAGVLLTKFRGDESLLAPGIEQLERDLGVPVLGVLPYDDPGLPAEDSVGLPGPEERGLRGDGDGVPPERSATIAVPRLPRVSNVTDLEPLAETPGLRVAYRPLDDDLDDADAVVLPGTKNAVDDCLAAREAGLDEALAAFDGPIVGLCGGYQLLGRRITGAALEGTGDRDVVEGLGLLPVETAFRPEKVVRETTLRVDGTGPLAGASGKLSGYEIHAGRTRAVETCATPFAPLGDQRAWLDRGEERPGAALGAADGDVLGTYLHGLFENDSARRAFASAAFEAAGVDEPPAAADRATPYDRAADLLREHADLAPLLDPLDLDAGD